MRMYHSSNTIPKKKNNLFVVEKAIAISIIFKLNIFIVDAINKNDK